ncbi:MAG: HAMP domain-containing histidine kinase [Proteobacteria bacterium]|nr:HAMP domain-containing histidine kinase [Pseudomonadota bacterium]
MKPNSAFKSFRRLSLLKQSLYFRIMFSFLCFGVVIAFAFGLILYLLHTATEDAIFERQLVFEIADLLTKYQTGGEMELPRSDHLSVYLGTAELPAVFKPTLEGLADGIYETDGPESISGPANYHVGIRTLPGKNERLYLLLNTKAYLPNEHTLVANIIISFVCVFFLALAIGLLVSGRVITPLKRLADLVGRTTPDHLPSGFSQSFYPDEVGSVAAALEQSLERVRSFVEREQRFTRDASHELRTPVTVIKGAVELLRQTSAFQEETANRLVERVDRSVADINNTIETLLWLAREESALHADEESSVLPIVRESVKQARHLFPHKSLSVEIHAEDDLVVRAPAMVIKIVVFNLIRNAYQFTFQGGIVVEVGRSDVSIIDTGVGIAGHDIARVEQPSFKAAGSPGFGFGLDIVKRLCKRMGWRLEIESEPEKGTVIRLVFDAGLPQDGAPG